MIGEPGMAGLPGSKGHSVSNVATVTVVIVVSYTCKTAADWYQYFLHCALAKLRRNVLQSPLSVWVCVFVGLLPR